MKVIVENDGNPVCIIEVGNFDTVLFIKVKIERCLSIPVSKQILFFKGRALLKDYLAVSQCNIVHDSRLQLLVSSNHSDPYRNHYQVLHQSPAPSNLTQQNIHGHPVMMSSNNSQLLQTTSMSNNKSSLPSSSLDEFLGPQDFPTVTVGSSRHRNHVVQTELSPEPSNVIEELLGQDFSMTTEDMIKMQSFWPQTTENISEVQESPMMVRSNNNQVLHQTEQFHPKLSMMVRSNNNQVLQTEQSPVTFPRIDELEDKDQLWTTEKIKEAISYLFDASEENLYSQDLPAMVRRNNNESPSLSANEELCGIEDWWPVTVKSSRNNESLLAPQDLPPITVDSIRNRNHVVQTQQYSPSDSVKEITDISDSAVKKKIKTSSMTLTVMVQPYKETSRRILLSVKVGDNVGELRKELVKLQERGELNLPQRYFFIIHNQGVLDEDQSFWMNGVAHGDTIEIVPGYVTYCGSQITGVGTF